MIQYSKNRRQHDESYKQKRRIIRGENILSKVATSEVSQ